MALSFTTGIPFEFIVIKTEAASSSCTCWCLEMSSFEVKDHSGVCSHLLHVSANDTSSDTGPGGAGDGTTPRDAWREETRGNTDRCLVRQLPCLYPLPHFSHLSSPAADLRRSPRPKLDPSLARRARAFVLLFVIDDNGGPSTIALEPL